jgi:L-fuculose-phosphate aldolase
VFYKKELIDMCHKVYEKGFVSGFDGNISVRASKNTFFITRSAVCKGDVTFNDILEIDSNGKIVDGKGKISTEFKIHLFVYAHREKVNAVIHCHPIYATAFAASKSTLDKPIFPEVVLTLGRIPLCEYATPSTNELHESMNSYIDYANVFLLQNHGAVAVGRNLKEAYYRMEKLEHYSKTVFIAKQLGGENEIPKQKLAELYSISEQNYNISIHPKNKF